MKKKAVLELSLEELKAKLADNKEKLVKVRFDKVIGHVENPLEERVVRREITRINTLIHEYETGIRKAK